MVKKKTAPVALAPSVVQDMPDPKEMQLYVSAAAASEIGGMLLPQLIKEVLDISGIDLNSAAKAYNFPSTIAMLQAMSDKVTVSNGPRGCIVEAVASKCTEKVVSLISQTKAKKVKRAAKGRSTFNWKHTVAAPTPKPKAKPVPQQQHQQANFVDPWLKSAQKPKPKPKPVQPPPKAPKKAPSTFIASMSGFSKVKSVSRSNILAPQGGFFVEPMQGKFTRPIDRSRENVPRFTSSEYLLTPAASSSASKKVAKQQMTIHDVNKNNITVTQVPAKTALNYAPAFSSSYKVPVFDVKKPATKQSDEAFQPPSRGRFTVRIDPSTKIEKSAEVDHYKSNTVYTQRQPNADPHRPKLNMAPPGSMYSISTNGNKSAYPSPMIYNKAFAAIRTLNSDESLSSTKSMPSNDIYEKPSSMRFSSTLLGKPQSPKPAAIPTVDDILAEAMAEATLPDGSSDFEDFEDNEVQPPPTSPQTLCPLVPTRAILYEILAHYGGELYLDVFLYEFYDVFGRELTTAEICKIFSCQASNIVDGIRSNFIISYRNNRLVLSHPNPHCTLKRFTKNWQQLYDYVAKSAGKYVSITDQQAQQFGFRDYREIYFNAIDHPIWRKIFKFHSGCLMLETVEMPLPPHIAARHNQRAI